MTGTDTRFVRPFIETLSRTERQVLMLFYAEELTHAEIGLVLDLAEARVRQLLESIQERARAVVLGGRTAVV